MAGNKPKHQWRKLTGLVIVLLFGVLSVLGSGGEFESSDGGSSSSVGWITITYPTEESSYPSDTSPQYLSGDAFISPTWFSCCTGDPSDTGVSVYWSNDATAQSAPASQHVRYCLFVLTPVLCDHTWSASIPVIAGNNRITVTAIDRGGNSAEKTITIVRSPDTTPPGVVSTTPANGETNVTFNQSIPYLSIQIVFNESIVPATVNNNSFTVQNFAGDPVSGTITVSPGGNQATFQATSYIAPNGTYIATLTTEITDLNGLAMSENYSWTFETGEGDTVAPTVLSTNPATDSTEVSTHVAVSATFSESMYWSSLNADTFQLLDAASNQVAGDVTAALNSATFTPANPLQGNSLYTAVITTGVTDEAGNHLESDYTWSFTTAVPDTTPPTVTSTTPANNEIGVAIDGSLTVAFSEDMDIASISGDTFLLEDSNANQVIGIVSNGNTFRPYANLALNETYTATITTGATDLAGNPLAQPYSWSFTTTADGVGTWFATSTLNAPSPRREATAVWTGTEMLLWGGDNGSYINTGGRYNPATDSWQLMSTDNAPGGCSTPVSVWTGEEMIVWCGRVGTGDRGGRYNPATDTWSAMSITNAPGAVSHTTAVWTGTEMIVWGGYGTTYSNTGGRYNPTTDTWQRTTFTGAPAPRVYHTAVWTGSEMIVWGGDGGPNVNIGDTGGRYDPATDSWSGVTGSGFLNNKAGHVAIWADTQMLIWNGNNNSARYDPQTDTWSAIATFNPIIDRYYPLSGWSGEQAIIWGGYMPKILNSGATYNPLTDSWNLMTFTNAPSGRVDGVSVWTGTEFIVWGGQDWTGALTNSGGRYRFP
ncbi:Ig-like domain-containing protein [Kaarinaea lacus]